MISQKDMLNIIATEAIEGPDWKHPVTPERNLDDSHEPKFKYGLRLVRCKDGTYRWED